MTDFQSRHEPLSDDALAQLFVEARTHHGWLDRPVDEAQLRRLYALWAQGPTAWNASPGRVLFIRSPEAKEKLKPAQSLRRRASSKGLARVAL